MQVTLTCQENSEEAPIIMSETSKKLSCMIMRDSNPVENLKDGIKSGLQDQVEKLSVSLERNAIYNKV